jgi:hypothetical protein
MNDNGWRLVITVFHGNPLMMVRLDLAKKRCVCVLAFLCSNDHFGRPVPYACCSLYITGRSRSKRNSRMSGLLKQRRGTLFAQTKRCQPDAVLSYYSREVSYGVLRSTPER